MKACHVTPNQNIKIRRPLKTANSLDERSAGIVDSICLDEPKRTFIQLLKKNVGASKYNNTIKIKQRRGNRSKKKLKNSISETNIIEPGKPKKTSELINPAKKSLGHKKFTPLISVINRVLNRRAIASTRRNELVDRSA